MRNIRKDIKSRQVEVTFYDREKKEEVTEIHTLMEFQILPKLPEGCILIESRTVENSEKTLTYVMSPHDFVKYATLAQQDSEVTGTDTAETDTETDTETK